MKITIWSDFVCPFCMIGQSHLDRALESFAHKDEVEIEYKSFLLMPDAEYVPNKSYAETLGELKGMPLSQTNAMLEQVSQMANQAGVNIDFSAAKLSSTVDAHRVFQYAKEQGKGLQFFKRFYAAHFSEGELLSDVDTVVRLAKEVGLDAEKAREIFSSDEYSDQAKRDFVEAQQIGVQGVPFFVFNYKYAVSGAQPQEAFSQVLTQVWEEEQAEKN